MGKFKEFLMCEVALVQSILEGTGITLSDYVNVVPSPRNVRFYRLRQEEGKTGSFLKEVIWDKEKDGLLLRYDVAPTYKTSVKTVDKSGKISKGGEYVFEVLIEDIEEKLGKKEEFLALKRKEQVNRFRGLLKTATIRIWSGDMSHWFQGSFEQADKYGYAIYKFPGPKGKGIWAKRHIGKKSGIYGTKHMIEVMKTIPFLVNKIIKMLNQ